MRSAQRGCSGKIAHLTRAEAREALENFRGRKGDAGTLQAYHCASCGLYHLGRDPRRRGPEQRIRFDMVAKARRYWSLVRGESM